MGLPELLGASEEVAKCRGRRGECLLALESGNSLVGFVWCPLEGLEVAILCKEGMGLCADSRVCRGFVVVCRRCQRPMGVCEARGMSGLWQRLVKWPAEPQRWSTQAVEGVREVRAGFPVKWAMMSI